MNLYNRKTDRQTDRQIDRQKDRQIDRQTDRPTTLTSFGSEGVFFCLPYCRSACLSVYLSIYPCIYLYVSLFVCLSVCISVCFSVNELKRVQWIRPRSPTTPSDFLQSISKTGKTDRQINKLLHHPTPNSITHSNLRSQFHN
jgi:hypothetical protein